MKYDCDIASIEEIEEMFIAAKTWAEKLESDYRKKLLNSLIDC